MLHQRTPDVHHFEFWSLFVSLWPIKIMGGWSSTPSFLTPVLVTSRYQLPTQIIYPTQSSSRHTPSHNCAWCTVTLIFHGFQNLFAWTSPSRRSCQNNFDYWLSIIRLFFGSLLFRSLCRHCISIVVLQGLLSVRYQVLILHFSIISGPSFFSHLLNCLLLFKATIGLPNMMSLAVNTLVYHVGAVLSCLRFGTHRIALMLSWEMSFCTQHEYWHLQSSMFHVDMSTSTALSTKGNWTSVKEHLQIIVHCRCIQTTLQITFSHFTSFYCENNWWCNVAFSHPSLHILRSSSPVYCQGDNNSLILSLYHFSQPLWSSPGVHSQLPVKTDSICLWSFPQSVYFAVHNSWVYLHSYLHHNIPIPNQHFNHPALSSNYWQVIPGILFSPRTARGMRHLPWTSSVFPSDKISSSFSLESCNPLSLLNCTLLFSITFWPNGIGFMSSLCCFIFCTTIKPSPFFFCSWLRCCCCPGCVFGGSVAALSANYTCPFFCFSPVFSSTGFISCIFLTSGFLTSPAFSPFDAPSTHTSCLFPSCFCCGTSGARHFTIISYSLRVNLGNSCHLSLCRITYACVDCSSSCFSTFILSKSFLISLWILFTAAGISAPDWHTSKSTRVCSFSGVASTWFPLRTSSLLLPLTSSQGFPSLDPFPALPSFQCNL